MKAIYRPALQVFEFVHSLGMALVGVLAIKTHKINVIRKRKNFELNNAYETSFLPYKMIYLLSLRQLSIANYKT